MTNPDLVIRGAREHNLQGLDLVIPRGRITVITGVSGSGKSSLAFDTLFREGQRRFLETLPAFARQFAGGLGRPALTSMSGLGPAVAVGQRVSLDNPRSTVGTLTEVWDLLRLLYARLGEAATRPRRALFSFNGPEGACPVCQGLGVEDRLDLDLLVADPARSLRDGALRVSTPNGYLMYSQVTLAVLDQVLRAHGGSVDIPWSGLTEEARQVVLYGSERLRVPYGKHPLESRLRWRGITARPREEGFYRGLVPVMEAILRGKRNDSILRFVRSAPCSACRGARLRPEALDVLWRGRRIVDLAAMTAGELGAFLAGLPAHPREAAVLDPIRAGIGARCALMRELGLGYLAFDRPAPTLSPGEAQRLRLLGLALGELRGLVLVLDEPSAGLHRHDVGRLLAVLRRLRDQGQTVVVVDHDPVIVRGADWLVDLGPGPGAQGGRLLWSGPPPPEGDTPTARWLRAPHAPFRPVRPGAGILRLDGLDPEQRARCGGGPEAGGAQRHIGRFRRRQDLPAGGDHPSPGFGRRALPPPGERRRPPHRAHAPFQRGHLHRSLRPDPRPVRSHRRGQGARPGQGPLHLQHRRRPLRSLRRGRGGRRWACATWAGSGADLPGLRGPALPPGVLAVRYRGRSVADLLEGSVDEAAGALPGPPPACGASWPPCCDCGLGHLPLGQPATTLSGGEAQRVKLAAELARAAGGARPHRPGRAHHRPARGRRRGAAGRLGPPAGRRPHPAGGGQRPGGGAGRGPGHRPGPRQRAPGRPGGGGGPARGRGGLPGFPHRGQPGRSRAPRCRRRGPRRPRPTRPWNCAG